MLCFSHVEWVFRVCHAELSSLQVPASDLPATFAVYAERHSSALNPCSLL